MKLKYLGTAAAEGYPAMFCNCENCKKALKEKGRNIKCRDRMLEEKLIDEKTKLVLNHFSHNGISSNYTDFVSIAADKGFEVSFDGMEIDV